MCSDIRVSSATASVIGLNNEKPLVAPTTAYLMTPERCSGGCSFCSQSQKDDRLSRVVWPLYPIKDVILALEKNKDKFINICVQTTRSKDYYSKVKEISKNLIKTCGDSCNINISIDLFYQEINIRELIDLGVNRISLAIDCVSEKHFNENKNGDLNKKTDFIIKMGNMFPDRISTHIIVGLKESDKEIIDKFLLFINNKVRCGLFAFTPLPGKKRGLSLQRYRIIQACVYLIKKDLLSIDEIIFNEDDTITGLKKERKSLLSYLRDGEFFRTSGCKGCNRPFYNEKVTELWYNFPRKPKEEEIEAALNIIRSLFT